MKIITQYSGRISDHKYNSIFKESVRIYRRAVDFFIDVCIKEWDSFRVLDHPQQSTAVMEKLTIPTKKRPVVRYDFNRKFYKMPCYLRRAAIAEAYGKVCSYMSNLGNWETSDPKARGHAPGYPKAGSVYPALYKDNMYCATDDPCVFGIKVWVRNTWDWVYVRVRKSDMDYINRYCTSRKAMSPTLQKRGKIWSLDFPFEEKKSLNNTRTAGQTIAAVDLGINSSATVSIMRCDGTVLGRHFLGLPGEYDCLTHAINRIKKAQQHRNHRTPRLWAVAKGINNHIAVRTAQFIIDTAVLYNVDVIVFEHLDTSGKKRGSKKQRLHHWRCQYVQSMVMHKAHRLSIRVSRICAWGTSRLAFDGSGAVLRGRDADLPSYSLCRFQDGKVYNCDLNASYNIGARYFIREILRETSGRERLALEAKVPQAARRSTCTLSTLISLNAALTPPAV